MTATLTSSMKRTNEKRVERGAQWLDATSPGWFNTVDLDLLELSDTCNCVIGQLVSDVEPDWGFNSVVVDPDYEDTVAERRLRVDTSLRGLVMTYRVAIQKGFEIDVDRVSTDTYEDYLDMQTRWTMKILARRELAQQIASA